MARHRGAGWSCVVLVLLTAPLVRAAEGDARQLFEKRLMPIFRSPQPSSCVQCHLAGVELRHFILPDHEKTFRSLRDQGLIDLDRPDRSRILRLIQRGAGKGGATQIQARMRQAEYEAFAAWIRACCADPVLRASPKLEGKDRAGPPRPLEVIRHARKDRLLASFERNIWAMRFRCMNCHNEGTPQAEKLRRQHGDRVAWFRKAGPEATMNYLLASKLIDTKDPEKSLLLLKPLGAVKHGGGIKFQVGDQGYKGFRAWIEDVTAIRGDRYRRVEDLPAREVGPLAFGSEIWLKLTDTLPQWADRLVQVSVYAQARDGKGWEATPIATSDRRVWGKGKLWQHSLTLLAAPDSPRAREWQRGRPGLPPGRYLVRVHVDAAGKLERDWKARLGAAERAGEAEVQARWREGYGSMTVLDARKVRR